MKQLRLILAILLLSVTLLGACTSNNTEKTENNNKKSEATEQTVNKEEVVVIISKDDGKEEVSKKTIQIKKGAILMDVMQDNFKLETDSDNQFITSIEGIKAEDGEKKGWIYTVNDEMPTVAATQYELSPGDQIRFDFQEWK